MKKGNSVALLPIGVFLALYLGLGLVFEYGLKIEMGFYNIPIVIAFLAAILVACLQNRKVPFDKKLEIMGQGVGDKNIITMLLIFLVAGAFVGVVGRSSAQSVAYFMLSVIPPRFAVAVLFVVACFVSTAISGSRCRQRRRPLCWFWCFPCRRHRSRSSATIISCRSCRICWF